MLRNVSDPTLTLFRPAGGTANGTGVIVVPGGGWKVLFREHEGIDVARWLAAQGYAAFVPRYRVRGTPALQAEHDAEMARDQMAIDATRKGKIRRSSPEWHKDDLLLYRVVEGLYADWTDAGLSAERHIYRRGGHGFGMVRQGMPSDLWPEQLRHWLADLGLADPGLADPGLDQGLSSNPEPDGGERDKRGIAGGQLVPRVRLRRPEGWLHGSRRGGILRGGRPAARRHFIRGRGSPW
jgi:hypothetical protein